MKRAISINKLQTNNKSYSGAEILLQTLTEQNIKYIVGYTGGAIMPVFDKLPNYPGLKFIMSRHEQGAAFIAQGYSRASGKLCPILTTSGPGATNTITGVADAIMDSVPILVITGQVSSTVIGSDAFQESDVIGLMYPITKYATMPLKASEVAKAVLESCYIALNGRKGPVCIDIPKNVQLEVIEEKLIDKKINLPGFKLPNKPKDEDIIKALDLINNSKRPVILAGNGIRISNTEAQLLKFIEKTSIPVACTLHGLSSLSLSHPLNLGMMGMHGEIEANRAIQKADLIIALGMRFDDRVTGKLDEYAKNAKVIHVEIDPAEINKNVRADIGINADLKDTIQTLTELVEVKTLKEREDFFKEIEENRKNSSRYYKEIFSHGYGPDKKLLMSRIVHELSEFTHGQDNIVADVGQHQMITAKFYKFQKTNIWFTSGGAGTMGFALPAGIGVKLARPDEEVWVVSGDGGIQMNIQELGTIMQHNVNINILLMNNSFLGMVRQWQDFFHGKRFIETSLINPNFELIAKAYGLGYRKVEKVEEIQDALNWSKNEQRATFVEFICDKNEKVYPMIPSGSRFEDMIVNEEDAIQKLIKNK